jgi:pimeloyl-ACP methyl ester carboxylesterase
VGYFRLSKHPPPGRIVSAAGTRFHVHELGAGAPPVILEAGVAATSLSWSLVQREAAKFARVFAYDRAGLGWSDGIEAPRTPRLLSEELHQLLRAASIDGPYILVGHSFGGLIAERFAIDHPAEVAGLVLVDALSPAEFCPLTEQKRQMLGRGVRLSRRGATLARIGVVRACLNLALKGNRFFPKLAARASSGTGGQGLTARLAGEIGKLPRDTWPLVAGHWGMPKSFESMARYLERLPESCAEMANARLPDVPTIVISAAANTAGPGVMLPPGTRFVTASRSGHWIQLDEPELVVQAIRDLLGPGSAAMP